MNIDITLFWYSVTVNVIAFIMMGIDKKRAKNQKWRIPEKNLWIFAIIGGAIGSIIGMQFFRHKTKHRLFTIGMPFILVIQVFFLYYIFW